MKKDYPQITVRRLGFKVNGNSMPLHIDDRAPKAKQLSQVDIDGEPLIDLGIGELQNLVYNLLLEFEAEVLAQYKTSSLIEQAVSKLESALS